MLYVTRFWRWSRLIGYNDSSLINHPLKDKGCISTLEFGMVDYCPYETCLC